jgi:tetratricopeptide (TPR) repeat protein
LTAFAVALALGLTTDVTRRFLSGGPDKVGLFSLSAQIFLALLAGGTFTQAGRQWIENAFDSFKIRKKHQARASFLLTAFVLLVIVGFWFLLPLFADYYNERGLAHLREGKLTHAVTSFERAVALNPDSARALYHLANAHESLLDYDTALAEYQRAVDADPNFKVALNNLAYLHMLHRSNYQKALDLLSRSFEGEFQSPEVEYAAYKNRGWAFLGLKQYKLAESDLRRALEISEQAEAHCMLGQALDAQSKPEEGIEHWGRCVELVNEQDQRIEPRWLAAALTAITKTDK